MISMFPILNDINNNQLTGPRAMPLKNITSDNQGSFAMGRRVFTRTYTTTPAINTMKDPIRGPEGKNRILPTIFDGTHTTLQKKWIGGNRDASQITANRTYTAISNGSLNAAGGLTSFTSNIETNTVRNAKIRTRCGGSNAPVKCGFRYKK